MMILTTGKYHTETEEKGYRTHMRLTIRNLHDKDFGKYRCLSKNSLGETEGAIRIYGSFLLFFLILGKIFNVRSIV